MSFVHQRHKPATALPENRELVLAIPPLRSNINLARIIRAAGCSGVRRVIVAGDQRIDAKIARDSLDFVTIERRRSLIPVLKKIKASREFTLIGLEQTTNSTSICHYHFPDRSMLVLGHERDGIEPPTLELLDAVVEIPVFGLPHSFNVATATAMALYEFTRQSICGANA
ncbi:MAG: hypothetical protein KDB27_04200 [Planctomycetales bacterium]|nr:hypothetical protein [Planctomycetales bacterium]